MSPSKSDALSTLQLATKALALGHGHLHPDTVLMIRHTLMDTLGVMIAARNDESVRAVRAERLEESGKPTSLVLGSRERLPPSAAALVNGTAAHALDYDDVNTTLRGHPSCVLWPAILALADTLPGTTQAQLIDAYMTGYWITGMLGQAMGDNIYSRGFHPTALLGAVGAAAAAGRLLGQNADILAHTLALGATQAAGLKAMFGSGTKPYHAGQAAATGIRAAHLASHGLRARQDGLEARFGFVHAFGSDPTVPVPILGEEVVLQNLFKFHASCYFTHAPIEIACSFREQELANPDRLKAVRAIRIQVNPLATEACRILHPRTALEAKFSIPHCVALALLGWETGALETFDAALEAPGTNRLRAAVHLEADDSLTPTQAIITIELTDGSHLRGKHDSGHPITNLKEQEHRLSRKYQSLSTPVFGAEASQDLQVHVLQTPLSTPWSHPCVDRFFTQI